MRNPTTHLRIEQQDGSVWEATGEQADKVMGWYFRCAEFARDNGQVYDGPPATLITPGSRDLLAQ